MQTFTLPRSTQQSPSFLRDEWVNSLEVLTNQILGWVQQKPEWRVDPIDMQNREEEPLETYSVPVATIHTPQGRLVLEPIARNFPGRGIVELYAWPTLFRVRLLQGDSEGSWQVRVDSGFVLHQEWNQENFIVLASDLLGAS